MDTIHDIVIANNYPSFEWYLNKIIKISEESPKEINYQLEIIKPLLEEILPQYQVVDTSGNSADTTKHTRKAYTLESHAAPDLLIAKNYKYDNKKKEPPEIHAVVEVKEQSSTEMFNRDIDGYSDHLIYEVGLYLSMSEDRRVIATNCRRWHFFERTEEYDSGFMNFFLSHKKYLIDYENTKNKEKWKESSNPENLVNEIENNKRIRELLLFENSILSQKSDVYEKYEVYCKALYDTARQNVKSCSKRIIDVLPNIGSVKTEQYNRDVEVEVILEDLLGMKRDRHTIIEAPSEWFELVDYIKAFVNP